MPARSDPKTKASEINVYLNGMLSVLGEDYTEVYNLHIEFKFQLSTSDVVIVQHKVYFDDKLVTVIGKDSNSMYAKFGTKDTLLANQLYTLSFSHGAQSFSVQFNTKIDPLYSTLPIIQNDLGAVLDGIADQNRILFLIYENGILAENIANTDNSTLLKNAKINKTAIPYVFKQYVRYRTELDIVMAMYILAAGRQGSESKALGQLKINKQNLLGMTPLGPILDDLKQKMKQWEKALIGKTLVSPLSSAVRAGNTAYPLTSPRLTFASGSGTASGSSGG
jgi:hypothetical protein